MTDSIMILAVPPPPQPPIGGCCCYLAKVRVGLKGISRVMPLLAFLLLEVLVELKGLARVMLLRVLCFGAYSNFLAFAQEIEDWAVLGPFRVIYGPISYFMFPISTLFIFYFFC